MLALIATYRVSDIVIGIMASPFLRGHGTAGMRSLRSRKVYGLAMTLIGAALGGVLAAKGSA